MYNTILYNNSVTMGCYRVFKVEEGIERSALKRSVCVSGNFGSIWIEAGRFGGFAPVLISLQFIWA